LLLISAMAIFTGFEKKLVVGYAVFLTGEVLDRIMYYIDLELVNIKTIINETIIPITYEKERS
jgi:hypothetical protein